MSATAVVRIADIQFRVSADQVLRVPRLADEVGATVQFDEVLMVTGDEPRVGTPTVDGAKVTAEILEHGRGNKITVFKKKRRKGYRKTQGHRQGYTAVRIQSIEG
ncbi:MAG TPA: 50S ribosomal protein L21 [Candidatus Krumholzibacteria bacterium]|jgi:large subunit ribosomal protein L21